MNGKEKSDSGLAVALKIKAHCVLYFFSYKALSQIIQEGVETSCLGKGLLGENVTEYGGVTLCTNVYRKFYKDRKKMG